MTTKELESKLKKIVLDLEDLTDNPSLDSGSKEELLDIASKLDSIYLYSIDL